ncbi:MAG TPA: carboxypeptidase regulatory-like domain-containing protein [Patescibacteria group bacterium]|nr:carboxypeptidase regulatory-like domain-containing protein [Patescibacteria group bacterium]
MKTHILARLALVSACGIVLALATAAATPASRSKQTKPPQSVGSSRAGALVDRYQKTFIIDNYDEAAKSGPERGENIYVFKCWMCHNEYAKTGPPLKNLFQQSELFSGKPVNDATVAAQIKNGGPGMPSFGTDMTGADIADLVSYLRSGKCCYEGDNPLRNPRYAAKETPWPVPTGLTGGVRGLVRSAGESALEGIKVQLIEPNGVRVTVMTDENGRYEFPLMKTGSYTLRIATPAPYRPYVREGVRIDGHAMLDDIVLERDPKAGAGTLPSALPPVPAIESQMSGSEILWNLAGTNEQKFTFARTCGAGCHSFQQIFRNRFDERSWRIIVDRMTGYMGNSLIVPRRPMTGKAAIAFAQEKDRVIRWLSEVRGPESKDAPVHLYPRSSGSSTRVVITEYPLPRTSMSPHDVFGDGKGNIWFTSHKTRYAGVLDPRTGIIKEYKMPLVPGALPGTHGVRVDKQGNVWLAEVWAHVLVRLNPRTGKMKQFPIKATVPINAVGISNFALGPDASIWYNEVHGQIQEISPKTGKVVRRFFLKKNPNPYEDEVSADGRFWAGGSPVGNGLDYGEILDIRTGKMYELNSGDRVHSAARGSFDPFDNAWFGGRDGVLMEIVNQIGQGKGAHIRTFVPPTPYFPYTQFYSAGPDRNGYVWAGQLHGLGFVRLDPRTGQWWEYDNPEPSAFARNTWVDDSTTPVTVWYVDFFTGYITRIQPLDAERPAMKFSDLPK